MSNCVPPVRRRPVGRGRAGPAAGQERRQREGGEVLLLPQQEGGLRQGPQPQAGQAGQGGQEQAAEQGERQGEEQGERPAGEAAEQEQDEAEVARKRCFLFFHYVLNSDCKSVIYNRPASARVSKRRCLT